MRTSISAYIEYHYFARRRARTNTFCLLYFDGNFRISPPCRSDILAIWRHGADTPIGMDDFHRLRRVGACGSARAKCKLPARHSCDSLPYYYDFGGTSRRNVERHTDIIDNVHESSLDDQRSLHCFLMARRRGRGRRPRRRMM